jgi:hypothetical protein
MKAYRGRRGIVPPIPKLGAKWTDQQHSRVAISRGKNPGTHRTGGWENLRDFLVILKKRKMYWPKPGFKPRTIQPVE